LLTDAREWSRLVDVLERERVELEDPFLSTQAALSAALVRADQTEAGSALEAFRPVFSARPDHLGALLAVEGIYVRAQNDAGLVATFERMAGTVKDPK